MVWVAEMPSGAAARRFHEGYAGGELLAFADRAGPLTLPSSADTSGAT